MITLQQIFEVLPHRYPMLLVDKVEEVEKDKICRGIKNVTINEPFFQGHYPGLPIMPGVLIIEAMAQAGAVLLLSNPLYRGRIPLIGAIDDVKFRRQVIPGDTLISNVELLWVRGSIGRMECTATVEGEMVAHMKMTFKLMDRES